MSSHSPPLKKRKVPQESTLNGDSNGMTQSSLDSGSQIAPAMAMVPNGTNGQPILPPAPGEIDESLYSRQLYVLGHEAMKRMAASDILISGIDGLGVEIAKCVILGGVRGVTLHDTVEVTKEDLTSQYYLTPEDIGKNRASACVEQLAELNTYVHTKVYTGELTPEYIQKFKVIVLCGPNRTEDAIRLSEFTHVKGISLILAQVSGVFGMVFCDFGPKFVVNDATGENPATAMIASITREKEGMVACIDESRHGFEDGDYVTFSEIKGMTQLNGAPPMKIKVKGSDTFTIGDTTYFDPYVTGGVVVQVKMPVEISFLSFPKALAAPEFVMSDFAKMDRPPILHACFQALAEFRKKHKRDPKALVAEDVAELVACAESKGVTDEVTLKFLKEQFANGCGGVCAPMASVIGGIVGQEVMKACSGKFMPIRQFFYFDALEAIPEGRTAESCQRSDSRYSSQIAVFGEGLQQKLNQSKIFVVGAGAIGCELLKNFAMMGIGTGESGCIIVTDMDAIEKSNLNRQFLFRPWDVQRPKSDTAAAAIKRMNPSVNIVAHQNRVGPETEKDYPDSFMESLDLVANALDNLDARTYMDRRCVYYCKPLLESGTLGTKGNVQVVIPHLTESYGSSRDPPEKDIPACTLHNFPNAIEHTLAWARDKFEGYYKTSAENAHAFLEDSKFVEKTKKLPGIQPLETLESVYKSLVTDRPKSFEDCVAWARLKFEDLFHNQIVQLLFNFPPDQKTSTGALFWSGPKRCPSPIKFDSSNDLHLDFVLSAANLRAAVYGIPANKDRSYVAQVADKVPVPAFKPKSGLTIAVTDAEHQQQVSIEADQQQIDHICENLPPREEVLGKINVNPLEFEKDDDTNFHMDFIVACSNLRAKNYDITPSDRHQSKLIAGRIIPAIATTTSLIAGLVCIELIKLVEGKKKLEDYKNGFVNLALPFFGFSEPISAPKKKYYDKEWTLWDRFEVKGEMTLSNFLKYFKDEHGLTITMLSHGNALLYSFFLAKDKLKQRSDLPMSEVVRKVTKKSLEPHVRALVFEITCDDKDGEDVEVPYVRYTLP